MRVLVAGFGNLLQRDDGFGVYLLRRLQEHPRDDSATIRFVEVGIGGITLVQELLDEYDALVVLDAIEGQTPGEIVTMEVFPDANRQQLLLPTENDFHHRDRFADIHYAEPGRAIALAHYMGRLPQITYLIGCVPESTELGSEMSTIVDNAVATALMEFEKLIASLLRQRITIETFGRID